MLLEVVGPDDDKARELCEVLERALAILGGTAEIHRLHDVEDVVERCLLGKPSLYRDGRLVCAGRIPTPEALAEKLQRRRGQGT